MRIALVGYMAAGKTFWANRLAVKMDLPFVDLDQLLEEEYLHDSISNFINKKGEISFRKLERQALLAVVEKEDNIILATGGGTPCYFNNMDVLNRHFVTVYLRPSIKTIVARLANNAGHRPLISHLKQEELTEFVAKHLFERNVFYAQAQIALNENDHTIESILNAINAKNEKSERDN